MKKMILAALTVLTLGAAVANATTTNWCSPAQQGSSFVEGGRAFSG